MPLRSVYNKTNSKIFKEISCYNVESLEKFYFGSQVIYNLSIKRDKVNTHLLIFRIFGSDVSQRFILGPRFFLIHINNLSNDIVVLAIKQSQVHAHVCSYINETWIDNPQCQLKMSFLISCVGKIDKFPKFSVAVCELWF